MKQGWVSVYRQIQDHWLWKDKPFSQGQAWIDLIMLANYEDKKMPYKGEIITCKRGTVNLSITLLADRWGWSRKRVRNFLKLLENDGMVTTKVTTHRTVITVENYGIYNDVPTAEGTTRVPTKEQQGYSKGNTTNNNNNLNNKKNSLPNGKEKEKHGEFKNVLLSEEELEKLKERFPYDWQDKIEHLSQYMKSKGKRYKSHYATILDWARRDAKKSDGKPKGPNGIAIDESKDDLDDIF